MEQARKWDCKNFNDAYDWFKIQKAPMVHIQHAKRQCDDRYRCSGDTVWESSLRQEFFVAVPVVVLLLLLFVSRIIGYDTGPHSDRHRRGCRHGTQWTTRNSATPGVMRSLCFPVELETTK